MTQRTPTIPASTLDLLKRAMLLNESSQLTPDQLQSLQLSGLSVNPQTFADEASQRSFNGSIRTRYGRAPTLAQRRAFATGDQWGPGGIWWTGLRPSADGTISMEDIERLFIQDDRIGPALDRRLSAVLGKDPEFSSAVEGQDDLQDQSQAGSADALLDEIDDALGAWWRDAECHLMLRRLYRFADWAGHAPMRININPNFAEKAVQGSCSSLTEALEIIDVQAIDPVQGGALRDEHGRIAGYYYRFQDWVDGQPVNKVELHTPEAIAIYLTPGLELDASLPVNPAPNILHDPARRRRPRFQMNVLDRHASAVTQGIIDKQASLNEEWANLKRNSQLGAFRQYIVKNAKQMTDPLTGRPVDYTFGPSVVLELYGVDEIDPTSGQPTGRLNTVDVQIVEPVDPEKFIKSITELQKSIDGDFDQAWAHEQNLRVSGASKQEAREAFEKGIVSQAPAVIELMRWLLETVLALAAWLEGNPGKYAGITFNPRLYLEISRGNLELFKALVPAYAAGLVSLETVIESNPGVVDAKEEAKRLEEQKAAQAAEVAARGDALNTLMNLPAGAAATQTPAPVPEPGVVA